MTVAVRHMALADRVAVSQILRRTPEFLPHEIPVAEEVMDASLNDPSAGYFSHVAEMEGQVVGWVCYGETPLTEGTYDVYWIAVQHDRQGHGIGRRLMAVAEADIKARMGRMILVETSSKSNYGKTRRFYEDLGYGQICVIPDFYSDGDGKVLFHKRLG